MLVHLTEEELALLLAGRDNMVAAGHLEICAQCRQHLEDWKANLHQLREDISFSSQRSGDYWRRQRNAITHRLEKTGALRNAWNFGWTLACYALALSLLLLAFVNVQQTQRVIGPSAPRNEVSDAALLSDLEERMSQELPEPLQPASLLVSEIGGGTPDQLEKGIRTKTLRK